MFGKKAQSSEKPLAMIIGIVILLVLAAIVIAVFVINPAKRGGSIFGALGSCTDPIVGETGECDCFFGGSCPGDSEASVNSNCPLLACDEDSFVTLSTKAKSEYSADVKRVEKESGVSLMPDQLRFIEAKHFGRCCVGAERVDK